MAFLPVTIQTLARSDSDGTDGSNIVVGAVVTITDYNGATVTMYDDDSGSNPSTAKTTDTNGQKIVYIAASEPNEYTITVNGTSSKRIIGFDKGTTTSLINSSRTYQSGDVVEVTGFLTNGDGGAAKWQATATTGLTPSQTPSERGDGEIVDASGRLWDLITDKAVDFRIFGDSGAAADNSAALAAAINYISGTGKYLTGASHGIDGTFETAVSDIDVRDIELIQINPTGATNTRTFFANSKDNIKLSRITVNMGDTPSAGSLAAGFAGVYINAGSSHELTDVEVTGNGNGHGLIVLNSSNFKLIRPKVHDIEFYNDGATDDSLEGIRLQGCSDFAVELPDVYNLEGDVNDGNGVRNRYTRGIAISGCSSWSLGGHSIDNVDQGVDLSGNVASGNIDFTISPGTATNCFTWGHKFANSANRGTITGAISKDCGYAGFVVNGGSGTEAGGILSKDLTFIGCQSINSGSNGEWSGNNPAGFLILPGSADSNTPYGVKFIGCKAIDDQSSATMVDGFRNTVTAREGKLNECIDCESLGQTGSAFNGMHFPVVFGRRTTTQSITTGVDTDIIYNTNETDTASMLNLSTGVATIKKSGFYRIEVRGAFEANSTGVRYIGIKINGSKAGRAEISVNALPSGPTFLTTFFEDYLVEGDEVKSYCYQNSGGALNLSDQGLGFSISKTQ